MFICHCRLHCYQNEKQQKRLVMLVQLLRLEMQSWWRNLKIQSEKWINFRNLCRGLCRKSLFPSSGCQLSWHSNVSVTHITSLDASVCKNPSLTYLFLHVALYVACLIETFYLISFNLLKLILSMLQVGREACQFRIRYSSTSSAVTGNITNWEIFDYKTKNNDYSGTN